MPVRFRIRKKVGCAVLAWVQISMQEASTDRGSYDPKVTSTRYIYDMTHVVMLPSERLLASAFVALMSCRLGMESGSRWLATRSSWAAGMSARRLS